MPKGVFTSSHTWITIALVIAVLYALAWFGFDPISAGRRTATASS